MELGKTQAKPYLTVVLLVVLAILLIFATPALNFINAKRISETINNGISNGIEALQPIKNATEGVVPIARKIFEPPKTEAEIKEELTSEAKKRASHWLIVKEVAKREHIAPSEEEITAQAEKLTKPYTEEQKKHLDNNRLKEYAYGIVIAEKVFQLLESNK